MRFPSNLSLLSVKHQAEYINLGGYHHDNYWTQMRRNDDRTYASLQLSSQSEIILYSSFLFGLFCSCYIFRIFYTWSRSFYAVLRVVVCWQFRRQVYVCTMSRVDGDRMATYETMSIESGSAMVIHTERHLACFFEYVISIEDLEP